ncbi:hypothetical protein [Streptomyces resistomycificus]|uniref:Uncharacterized protein n=1 Tax=Streptomyces resistomycificus TaxID=67356 RepID=A0A0L8L5H3_9ACTN|nr:hypothetical protein [Streptomyces resistomycificus]KOG33321.1 hypothetical protein ADK37_23370 [Streptomyces resistomycificus]KUN99528.1 hypothetical protein AQJ84_11310 [Streptomyces resistomycificus]
MARIRTIKPEFFTSLTIADLTPEQRLTFIGLWTHADDAGRCVDDARLIKAAIWPLDDRTAADIEIDLKALTESSLITRYTLNRKRYIAVTGWIEHQRINRPTPSKLPAPEEGDPTPPDPVTRHDSDSLNTHAHLSEDSSQERKGREGNREGKGNPPTPRQSSDSPAVSQTGERAIEDRMTDAFLDRYRAGNAYSQRQVRKVIADALANGTDSGELWQALERLGSLSKPVSPGTLQFAFSEMRQAHSASNVIALPSGQTLTGTDAKVAGWADIAAQLAEQGDSA